MKFFISVSSFGDGEDEIAQEEMDLPLSKTTLDKDGDFLASNIFKMNTTICILESSAFFHKTNDFFKSRVRKYSQMI